MLDYTTTALMIGGGLIVLALGGEFVIKGGVGVAKTLSLSPLFVGIVLLGFGTSLPELATSIESVRVGASAVAIGNVVGSNIANILMIVGLAASLAAARVSPAMLMTNGLAMVASMVALAALLFFDAISALSAAALLAALTLYLLISAIYGSDKQDAEALLDEEGDASSLAKALGYFAFGLAATLIGAYLLVDGATTLAREAMIPEAIIGATIVAIGTSLPELATTIAAARRGRSNMAVGNVIGSNIFNSLGIIGVAAFFGPMPTPPEILSFDLWVMLIAALLFFVFASSGGRIFRIEGFMLLSCYGLYLLIAAQKAV